MRLAPAFPNVLYIHLCKSCIYKTRRELIYKNSMRMAMVIPFMMPSFGREDSCCITSGGVNKTSEIVAFFAPNLIVVKSSKISKIIVLLHCLVMLGPIAKITRTVFFATTFTLTNTWSAIAIAMSEHDQIVEPPYSACKNDDSCSNNDFHRSIKQLVCTREIYPFGSKLEG